MLRERRLIQVELLLKRRDGALALVQSAQDHKAGAVGDVFRVPPALLVGSAPQGLAHEARSFFEVQPVGAGFAHLAHLLQRAMVENLR